MDNFDPWGSPVDGRPEYGGFGRLPGGAPKPNFWGDIDGDGRETAWDDVLGDGLLMDAFEALRRAERGEPPEPEDEDLVGADALTYARYRASHPPATTGCLQVVIAAVVVLAVLLACGLLSSATERARASSSGRLPPPGFPAAS